MKTKYDISNIQINDTIRFTVRKGRYDTVKNSVLQKARRMGINVTTHKSYAGKCVINIDIMRVK